MLIGVTSIVGGERLAIDLRNSDEELGFLIVTVDGLGSSPAVVSSAKGAVTNGARVNNVKLDTRTITMTFGVSEVGKKETEALEMLYNFFPTGKKITLEFSTEKRTVFIEAYPEDMTLNMFAPVENAVITALAPKSVFTDTSKGYHIVSNYTSLFEFPFSNESLLEPLIEFGHSMSTPNYYIYYPGDIDTGIYILVEVIEDSVFTDLTLYNLRDDQKMVINMTRLNAIIDGVLQVGDKILIDTRTSQKSIKLFRNGQFINIHNALDLHSDWIYLSPGHNTIIYTMATGQDAISVELEYFALYSGVA